MALRFYIVPVIGTGASPTDARRPKYISGGGIAGTWSALDYGFDPAMLVAANVTSAENTAISANADVVTVPASLDLTIGSNLTTVQGSLEAFNIPAGWVTSAMTFRFVVRWIGRLFKFCQRMQGLGATKLFPAGITLDSFVGDLTTGQRQKVTDAANSLGLSVQGITLTTTMRVALKMLADQLPDQLNIGGISL